MKSADSKLRHTALGGAAFVLVTVIASVACPSLFMGHARAQAVTAPAEAAVLDVGVAAALRRMAATLGGAAELTVRLTSLRETPIHANSDQTIMLSGTVAVGIRRPDQLAVLVGSDRGNFRLWYDGEVATLLSLTANAYARHALPGDIDIALETLERRLGVDVPLRDLLAADPYAALTEPGTTGALIGRTLVNGAACDHYVLRNRNVDWQIWIAAEEPALPCRLVVVDRSAPGAPRAVLEFLDWNLSPQLDPETFTFTAPADAHEVRWIERPAAAHATERR